MLKKKLNSTTPFSTFLLCRKGRPPPPLPSSSTTCSSSDTVPSISPFSFPFSSSCPTEIEEDRFSFSFNFYSSRVFQTPRINFGSLGQSSNLFCSSSCVTGKLQCWNCNSEPPLGNKTPFLVCESCRSVQPVNHSIDYFQILGFCKCNLVSDPSSGPVEICEERVGPETMEEKKYEIEGENLEGKYKDWQKKLHPDLVHTKSQKEREYAAEQSARVNDAYRTLTDPLSRAKYILKLHDVELDEEERITDPELLAEIMEIRESVEEAAEIQGLHQIQGQIRGKLEDWCECFADAFKSREYDEAKASIRRMTYYKRAIEEITKKL